MIMFIKNKISVFGILPLCNLNAERAFYIGSFCFPFCVRCTAIIFGIILTIVIKMILKCSYNKKWIVLWVACIIPCLIDGVIQYFFKIESTNIKRLIFGGLCGYGIGGILVVFIKFLDKIIIKK